MVTPTYPYEETYETRLPTPEPTDVNHEDQSDHEDHEEHTGYEDPVDHEDHTDHEVGHEDHFNHEDEEEIFNPYSEEVPLLHTGAISGTPGVEFPDYQDIPVSSFNCTGHESLPGFYADLETGCQVNMVIMY